MCATREKLGLAPDCRQGRMASIISQHTQEPPHGGFPAWLGGSSTGPPEPVTWVTPREEEVTLYGLVASFITDIIGGGKKSFCAQRPSLTIWGREKQIEVNGEVIRAERQDPGGEAKSQRGFLYPRDFIHPASFGCERCWAQV